jgi:hypothetical protein
MKLHVPSPILICKYTYYLQNTITKPRYTIPYSNGFEPLPVHITFGLRVRRHVHPLNGDFSLIVYYQNDTIYFKQNLFSSRTERFTQGASGTPAVQRH